MIYFCEFGRPNSPQSGNQQVGEVATERSQEEDRKQMNGRTKSQDERKIGDSQGKGNATSK